MNSSRIAGPLIAGALIASAGSAWAFVLNAALSVFSGFLLIRWRRQHVPSPLGRERLFSAIRVGVQFVVQWAGQGDLGAHRRFLFTGAGA